MTESECENFAGSFVEHKYCTGKPLVAQDTCQVIRILALLDKKWKKRVIILKQF